MKISPAVMAILSNSTCVGSALTLPPGNLDRPTYEAVNKALVAAGGKWNRVAKAHLFAGDAYDAVEPIFLTGEIVDAKRTFEAFFTPRELAVQVCQIADVRPGLKVLEPSAGEGALALQAADLGADVYAIEIQEKLSAALENTGRLMNVKHADFMACEPHQYAVGFDRVVMNPPFARQADILHVIHALRFLAPGGVLVSIMAASVSFRDNDLTRNFRAMVESRGGTISALPDGSFKSSGTMVNTVVVVIPG